MLIASEHCEIDSHPGSKSRCTFRSCTLQYVKAKRTFYLLAYDEGKPLLLLLHVISTTELSWPPVQLILDRLR